LTLQPNTKRSMKAVIMSVNSRHTPVQVSGVGRGIGFGMRG